MRQRLRRAGADEAAADATVRQLRQHHLLDDAAFARDWVEQRQTFRPRGARLVRSELRQRGVDAATAEAALETLDDSAAAEDAYRAGVRRARQLAGADERTFSTRLGQFLARRGFDWGTIASVVDRLWCDVSTS